MNMTHNIHNALFKRREIAFIMTSGKNPSYEEVRTLIAEKNSVPSEHVNVQRVLGSFGKNTFLVHAHVYDTAHDFEKIKTIEKTRKQKKEETKKLVDDTKKKAEELKAQKSAA